MGVAKEKMMSIAARGYGESNKYVCSGCVKDQYLQKVIRAKGQVGTCSFCKDENGKPIRHRKNVSIRITYVRNHSCDRLLLYEYRW